VDHSSVQGGGVGRSVEGVPHSTLQAGLRGDNYRLIDTPDNFTVLMQTMDRQNIKMQRVHHVLKVAFHILL